MKKLCFAVLFYLLTSISANADQHGMYVRVECNPNLGLLDISYELITGEKIGFFFEQEMNDYKYDINGNIEIVLINGYYFKEPYQYHCKLAQNQKFDITVERENPQRYINNGSFYINVTEHQEDLKTHKITSTKIVDNVIIGAGGHVERILIAARDKNKASDITLTREHLVGFFLNVEEYPLNDAEIQQKIKRMEKYEEEEKQQQSQTSPNLI